MMINPMSEARHVEEDRTALESVAEDPRMPPAEPSATRGDCDGNCNKEQDTPIKAMAAAIPTLHGHPLTISQCKFQAHIARINTFAEAKAISEAISSEMERDVGFAGHVCPFAYRLACVEGDESQAGGVDSGKNLPEAVDPGNGNGNGNGSAGNGRDEGFCDKGDVGSGEKLLYLLQKWDVRHRVLLVTRIDGGFAMGELLGVRRYKFVIDRAKRLLENCDLASLRRAVDADLNPPQVVERCKTLVPRDPAVGGHQHLPRDGPRVFDASVKDSWDRFILPASTRRRVSGLTEKANSSGEPGGSSGCQKYIPPRRMLRGGRGHGGLEADGMEKDMSMVSMKGGGAGAVELTKSTRERRALSLAQLSISSNTIAFPPTHVPSMMGDKGHGIKRGRINHFAVRSPTSSRGRKNSSSGATGDAPSVGLDPGDGPASRSSNSQQRGIGTTAGWHLPHELDPTSATTSLESNRGNAGARGGSNSRISGAACSTLDPFHDPSSEDRDAPGGSSPATVGSPSRISVIMLGVFEGMSKDHPLHPPPPAASAAANIPLGLAQPSRTDEMNATAAGRTPGGFPFGGALCDGTTDVSASSHAGGGGYRQHEPPIDQSGVVAAGDIALQASGASQRRSDGRGGGDGGLVGVSVNALPSSATTAIKQGRKGFAKNGDDAAAAAPGQPGVARDTGKNHNSSSSSSSSGGLPFPLLSRMPGAGVREDESFASVGGWDADGTSSISTTDTRSTFRTPVARPPGEEDECAGEEGRQHRQVISPGVWSLGERTPRERIDSGGLPRSSSNSMRGWTAGRTASAQVATRDGIE